MNRFYISKGDDLPFFIFSLVNGIMYVVWTFAYILCLILRGQAFSTAQTNMMLTGQSTYTVEVTSPFFAVLKIVAMALPVILTAWTVYLFVNDRKGKELCDKIVILSVFGADLLCGIMCLLDLSVFHMILV